MDLLLSLTLTYLCLVLNYLLINRNNAVFGHSGIELLADEQDEQGIFSAILQSLQQIPFILLKSLPFLKVYKSTLCMPQSSNSKQKNSCGEVEAAWERFQQTWQILFSGWQCCIKAYIWCYSLLRPQIRTGESFDINRVIAQETWYRLVDILSSGVSRSSAVYPAEGPLTGMSLLQKS